MQFPGAAFPRKGKKVNIRILYDCNIMFEMEKLWTDGKICIQHNDSLASAMGIHRQGQLAVLAGRRSLSLLNLDEPDKIMTKLSRSNKWEVGLALWGPLSNCQNIIALSCNQVCELYQSTESSLNKLHNLHAHTRAICDLDWHKFNSNLLISCSADSYVYVWDIRTPEKSINALMSVASASQVKWNKVSNHIFATSHEGDIRLWDLRKLDSPTLYITAHISKIYSLDWSQFHKNIILTSSQDFNFKILNVDIPRTPENTQRTNLPVYKAKFTPFLGGLITVLMPQFIRESTLSLWNCKKFSNLSIVHTLEKYPSALLDFDWRKFDHNEYHLIMWFKDCCLRIWIMNQQFYKPYGDESQSNDAQNFSSYVGSGKLKNDEKNYFQNSGCQQTDLSVTENLLSNQPVSLKQEFLFINKTMNNIQVEKFDLEKRSCRIIGDHAHHKIFLKVVFPPTYPYNVVPSFHFMNGTTLNDYEKDKVLKILRETSLQYVKDSKFCLEPCMQELNLAIEDAANTYENIKNCDRLIKETKYFKLDSYKGLKDTNLPYPRTSGARFCGAASVGCKDLVHLWNLLELILLPIQMSINNDSVPWSVHPFGQKLFHSLDIQTSAMLCCIADSDFLDLDEDKKRYLNEMRLYWGKWFSKQSNTPYRTFHANDGGLDVHSVPKQNRSNSWCIEEKQVESSTKEYFSDVKQNPNTQFLATEYNNFYTSYKKAYADVLYQWQLLESRAQILKYSNQSTSSLSTVNISTTCSKCQISVNDKCLKCKQDSFKCALCRLIVKGAIIFCLFCNHGGHATHIFAWFEKHLSCPAGCGCDCMKFI